MKIKIEFEDKIYTYDNEGKNEDCYIEKTTKTFEQTKFKGRVLRNLLEIQGIFEGKQEDTFTIGDYDLMCEFLVNTFDNQFTTDDLLDGLETHEIMGCFGQVAEEIMKKTNDKMGKIAKK